MTTNQTAMPEVPKADFYGSIAVPEDTPLYTAEQMQAYARAAIQALSQQSEPVAWGVPNTRPSEGRPFMQLLHSCDGVQYPELLVPLYANPCASNDAERYKQQRDRLLDFIKRAPVSSGVCCCGDSMNNHPEPMMCGHSPVDEWDDAVSSMVCEIEQIDAALTNNGENNV